MDIVNVPQPSACADLNNRFAQNERCRMRLDCLWNGATCTVRDQQEEQPDPLIVCADLEGLRLPGDVDKPSNISIKLMSNFFLEEGQKQAVAGISIN